MVLVNFCILNLVKGEMVRKRVCNIMILTTIIILSPMSLVASYHVNFRVLTDREDHVVVVKPNCTALGCKSVADGFCPLQALISLQLGIPSKWNGNWPLWRIKHERLSSVSRKLNCHPIVSFVCVWLPKSTFFHTTFSHSRVQLTNNDLRRQLQYIASYTDFATDSWLNWYMAQILIIILKELEY